MSVTPKKTKSVQSLFDEFISKFEKTIKVYADLLKCSTKAKEKSVYYDEMDESMQIPHGWVCIEEFVKRYPEIEISPSQISAILLYNKTFFNNFCSKMLIDSRLRWVFDEKLMLEYLNLGSE